MPRKARKVALAPEAELDGALATVREGMDPRLRRFSKSEPLDAMDEIRSLPLQRFATVRADDPYEEGKVRPKVISLRDDHLAVMYARGTIDEIQLKAGRYYQQQWLASEIGGARAIDIAKDRVDGGKLAEPDTDRRLRAHAELARLHRALGEVGSELCGYVLGHGMPVAQVAQMWDQMESNAYRALRFRFAECLKTIAHKAGFASRK